MNYDRFARSFAGRVRAIVLVALATFALSDARGVILLETGDPEANTTAPTGTLAGSGWQYQGSFGGFLGTPIAPQFFMTATHVSGGGGTIVYNNVTYTLAQRYDDPFSDLTIWQIVGTFPSFAPLYTGSNETGQPLVVFGRGTLRGGEVFSNAVLRGWGWGAGDGRMRWGQNVVTGIVNGGPLNEFIFAEFNNPGVPNEAHLSSGDSGGAVFISEGGVWKLAAINYAVDGPFFTDAAGNGGFFGALFDARGFFYQEGASFTPITGPLPVPSGFYSSRISSKQGWIYSVIDPGGDIDGNGISNLLDYAASLNAPAPAGPGAPTVVKEGSSLAMTFRRLTRANAPLYIVEQSTNLRTWTAVTQTPVFISSAADVETVKVQVPMTGNRLFLRISATAP